MIEKIEFPTVELCDEASATTVIESWRKHYNHDRPHSSLGYLTPIEY
ncbi:MAG: integrase core domain-containing protein [Planctomycetota bacterium]|jgi:putative transposase